MGGDACGERRVPPAQRLTLVEPGRVFSTPRGREPERAAPGEDPRPLRAPEGQVRVPAWPRLPAAAVSPSPGLRR